MIDLEEWNPTSPDEIAERRTMVEQLEEQMRQALADVEAQAPSLHAWIRSLTAEAEAAREEYRRVQKAAQLRERRLERVRTLVKTAMVESGIPKLKGSTWSLSVRLGQREVMHNNMTPVPPRFAEPIKIDPQIAVPALLRLLAMCPADTTPYRQEQLLADDPAPHVVNFALSAIGFCPLATSAPLVAHIPTVKKYIKETGDIPEGFTVFPPGHILTVSS